MQKITRCRSCGAEIIFLQTEKGHLIPTNPNLSEPKNRVNDNDVKFDAHRHISHFATCHFAKTHRKSDKKKQLV